MTIWQTIANFLRAPIRVQELEQQLADYKVLIAETRDKLITCQNEKSAIIAEGSLALESRKALEDQISQLNIVLADKDSEIQALKDSQDGAESALNNLVAELANLRQSYQQLTELYGIAQNKLVDIETLTDQIYEEVTVGSSG